MEVEGYLNEIREEIVTEAMYQFALASMLAQKRLDDARDQVARAWNVLDSLAQEEEEDEDKPAENGPFHWRLRHALDTYSIARGNEVAKAKIVSQLKNEEAMEFLQDLQECLGVSSQLPLAWLEYMQEHGRPKRTFETWL
jgi:hypothetical protein